MNCYYITKICPINMKDTKYAFFTEAKKRGKCIFDMYDMLSFVLVQGGNNRGSLSRVERMWERGGVCWWLELDNVIFLFCSWEVLLIIYMFWVKCNMWHHCVDTSFCFKSRIQRKSTIRFVMLICKYIYLQFFLQKYTIVNFVSLALKKY